MPRIATSASIEAAPQAAQPLLALNTLTNYVNETVKTEIDFPAVTTNPLRKAA